jgi:NADPH-dependent glutamate synthase beta subunit-like oxidoreductase
MDVIDFLEKSKACFQDEPPFCTSGCPLRLDARGLAERIRKGDFKGAFRLYRRQVLFPGLLSRICTEPCAAFCARKDYGGAVRLRLLERACAEYAGTPRETAYAVPPQTGEAAVVGGGLTGLACALTLGRRGYRVTLYEASGLWGAPCGTMERIFSRLRDPEELEQVFAENTVTVCLNTEIKSLDDLEQSMVLLATA